ncbi:MAG: precorrin-6Y C5,15-methyltransferase (decarboxylating) subunit CbiT, partial [Sulfolobaceae archaeon]
MKWEYAVPGIPDNYFEREESIPMTKEEIRALALSKARVRKGDKFLDIGCGTGSVTVEAALLVGDKGKVYGIDKDEKAINLTRKNAEKFGVSDRIVLIHGEVPQILEK